ncbi:glycoside hydrolase superfamily [Dactylonectria estremocensis]|uniref:cellulase n=1 Tax=Dactylonectria estremocensis TaxID=1079267 RepID=A0A9P9EBC8_9HYPO|nr:glycoside hydrolase superfamily [Dactylonectria estremocensis]
MRPSFLLVAAGASLAACASSAAAVEPSVASSSTSSAASSESTGGSSSGFLFTGINESGAEFGTAIPGTEGTDYTFPNTSAIDILFDAGMNSFRVGFTMERMIPDELTGTLDSDYFEGINTVVTHITGKGAYAILDPHNYGRYYSNIITDVDAFGSFWTTLATKFADNELVIFDTNNEYHDMENSLVAELNQAAITAIRGAGATSQYIFVEGNSYSGAWTWVSSGNGDALVDLTDPQDKLIYEMHQYLDSDGSGTSETCVDSTIGATRLAAATAWLKENGKLGVLGETAGGNNDVCKTAIKGELQHLQDNSDVWVGFLWWAAGPWWGDYMFSMEPADGSAYDSYLSIVQDFF